MREYIVFIGAGASVPFGVPAMTDMVQRFEQTDILQGPTNLPENKRQRSLYLQIKERLSHYEGYDIEAVISVLEELANPYMNPAHILNIPSLHYLTYSYWHKDTDFVWDSMVRSEQGKASNIRSAADELLKKVKRFVVDSCRIRTWSFDIYDEFFHQVMWTHGRNYRQGLAGVGRKKIPCSIFTTNYDQVLEAYCRDRDLEFECGEAANGALLITSKDTGLYNPHAELFQIHKLHGSINWYEDARRRLRCTGGRVQAGRITDLGEEIVKELLIYPAVEKYTYREPFYTMFHYLKECLVTCKACYVVGYSFRDEDILGLFHDSMERKERLNLTLIDKNANTIVEDKFQQFPGRVKPIEREFSVAAAQQLA